MPEEKRKRFTSEEKVRLLKEHLLGGKAVSDVCERAGIAPTMFYRWQAELFGNAAVVFEGKRGGNTARQERQIAMLEEKLTKKNEVLSELMEEHIALKKRLGVI